LFTSREFATLLKWKLGLPLGMPPGSKCSRCQHILNPFGDHLVRCSNNGLYKRHNELRFFLQNLFRQAGFTTRREVSVEGGLRPADLLIEDWDGKPLALDISYRHAHGGGWCQDSAIQAISQGEAEKVAKYSQLCTARGWEFRPFVVSPFGLVGQRPVKLLILSLQG